MDNSNIYYNNKTKQSATDVWLSNCGLLTDPVRAIAGWLPLIDKPIEYNQYTEKTVPDGQPYPAQDGQYFIQKLKTEKLNETELSNALVQYKATRIAELKSAYEQAISNGVVSSSAGFDINANTKAISDIENLIKMMTYMDTKETDFCAADNSFHSVSLEDLNMMLYEVIDYVQQMQATKWKLRKEIESSADYESCSKIEIQFS